MYSIILYTNILYYVKDIAVFLIESQSQAGYCSHIMLATFVRDCGTELSVFSCGLIMNW